MNKQDIDKASSALTGAITYFAPMVTALNQADEVFSVLSNAIKFKTAIEKEVDALKSEIEPLKAEVETSKAAITANDAAAVEAKVKAEKEIADATAQAKESIKLIQASVADRVKKATEDADAKVAEITAATEKTKAEYDSAVAAMESVKNALTADITALETKLASLREKAKKFAASLVE